MGKRPLEDDGGGGGSGACRSAPPSAAAVAAAAASASATAVVAAAAAAASAASAGSAAPGAAAAVESHAKRRGVVRSSLPDAEEGPGGSGPELNPDEVEAAMGEVIGEGTFGAVYRGELHGTPVAIKHMYKESPDEQDLAVFRQECRIMASHSHTNVCRILGACTIPPNLYLVTELLEGDVSMLLYKADTRLNMFQRLRILQDTARGMAWLHEISPPIIHRDLKPPNLLYKTVAGDYEIKITDFGLSSVKSIRGPLEQLKDDPKKKRGTPLYMSPEVIRGSPFDEKSDVYSFGIVAWEILRNEEPYPNHRAHGNYAQFARAVVIDQERPALDGVPGDLHDLLKSCWDPKPIERPSFPAILKMIDHAIPAVVLNNLLAAAFWRESFDTKNCVAEDYFIPELLQYCGWLSPPQESVNALRTFFRQIASPADGASASTRSFAHLGTSQAVTLQQFQRFLEWFGPFAKSAQFLRQVCAVLQSGWFFGNVDGTLLFRQLSDGNVQPGTFLVRCSSQPGLFTVSAKRAVEVNGVRRDEVRNYRITRDGAGALEIFKHRCGSLPRLVKVLMDEHADSFRDPLGGSPFGPMLDDWRIYSTEIDEA